MNQSVYISSILSSIRFSDVHLPGKNDLNGEDSAVECKIMYNPLVFNFL